MAASDWWRLTRTKSGNPGGTYTPVNLDEAGKAKGRHKAGDVNVDVAGPYLNVCTADGDPGTWTDLVAKALAPNTATVFAQQQTLSGSTGGTVNAWVAGSGTLSVTSKGKPAIIFFAGCCDNNTAGSSNLIGFRIDGGAVLFSSAIWHQAVASDFTNVFAVAIQTLSPGAHTIGWAMQCSSGTLFGNPENVDVLGYVELAA